MAEQHDVSLTVGLEAGDVTKTASDLQKAVEGIFENVKGDNTTASIEKLKLKLTDAYKRSQQLSEQIARHDQINAESIAYHTNRITELNQKIQEQKDLYNGLLREMAEMKTANSSGFTTNQGVAEYLNSLKELMVVPESLKVEVEQVQALLDKGFDTDEMGRDLHKVAERLMQDLEAIKNARKEYDDAVAYHKSMGDIIPVEASDSYKQLEAWAKRAKKESEELTKQLEQEKETYKHIQSDIEHGSSWDELENKKRIKELSEINNKLSVQIREINEATAKLRKKQEAERLANEEAAKKLEKSAESKKEKEATKELEKPTGIENLNPLSQIDGWQALINVIKQGPKAVVHMADTIVSSFASAVPAIQLLYVALKKLISLCFQFAKELTNAFKVVAVKAIHATNVALKALLKTLVKVAGATILKPIQKLGEAFANLGKKATSSNMSMKKFGRMILQYGIGARSLYRLVNKLRTALFEGFGTLANFYEPFNDSMSQITTALEYLKNSFAAAFAPIIQVVAPALSLFINQVATAVQMIGQFIAALTGREFVMAMPVYKDYAETSKVGAAAAKETAAAEKAAAKAEKQRAKSLKEVQRTIAGFDDVEILKEPTNSSSDTDSGSSPVDTPTLDSIASTFKTAPIESALKSFADLIKKAWLEADFYDIGQLMSKQLGNLLKSFNDKVPKIEKFADRLGRSVGSFLAGFLSIQDTFVELGKAIGNGINILFTFLNSAVLKFMEYDGFKNLGLAIYNTIYNALKTIKWETIFQFFSNLGYGVAQTLNESLTKPELWQEIFKTLSNMMTSIFLAFYRFVTTLKWSSIGSAIGSGINTAIETYPLSLLANSVAKFVNGIFTAIGSAARKIKWSDLGKNIADSIMLFFKKTTWKQNGMNLAAFIQGIFNALESFVENTHFDEIAQDIVDFIKGFFAKFNWKTNLATLAKFFNGLLDAIRTAIAPINWKETGKTIVDGIIEFFDNFHWREAIDTIFNLIGGLIDLLYTVVNDGRLQGLGVEIIDKIKEKLGSPEWEETTDNLWNLFLHWLEFKVLQIVGENGPLWIIAGRVLDGLAKGLVSFALKTIGNPYWLLTYLITPFLEGLKKNFGITSDNDGATETKSIGISVIWGIIQGILEKVTIEFTPVGLLKLIVNPFLKSIKEAFGITDNKNGSSKTLDIGKAIIKGITGGIGEEEPNLNKKSDSVNKTTQKNLSAGDWSGIGSGRIIGGVKSGMDNNSGSLYTLTQGINNSVFTKLSKGDWYGIGSKTMIGNTRSGMDSQNRNIQNSAAIINTGLFQKLSAGNWFSIGDKTMIAGVKSGMNNQNRYIQNTAQAINSGIFKNMQAGNWLNMGYTFINLTKNGMANAQNLPINQAKTIQSSIYTNLSNGNYNVVGSNISNGLYNGLSYNSYKAENEASSIARTIGWNLDTVDGYSIGDNIASGIHDGLDDNWNWLSNTAWNLAVDLYNSACRALGIRSPSKVFADKVGAMIPAGIAVGIKANSGIATKTIDNMTDSIVDSATNLKIPPIAMGEIIPYNTDVQEESSNTLKSVLDVLQSLREDTVRRDELEEILTNIARDYFDVRLQIGDETIARHANNGNRLLNVRYNLG